MDALFLTNDKWPWGFPIFTLYFSALRSPAVSAASMTPPLYWIPMMEDPVKMGSLREKNNILKGNARTIQGKRARSAL